MAIKQGDTIKVDYTGILDDGTVFDSSEGKEPIQFKVGEGKVIKGFDDAVQGMEVGQEKEFKIPSKEAYGEQNDKLLQKIPRDKIPGKIELKKGAVLKLQTKEGPEIGAIVKDFDDKEVTIDFNHPLAGKDLTFKIKIVSVE